MASSEPHLWENFQTWNSAYAHHTWGREGRETDFLVRLKKKNLMDEIFTATRHQFRGWVSHSYNLERMYKINKN